jgi:L-lactate dehydrogenase complex protein LldF
LSHTLTRIDFRRNTQNVPPPIRAATIKNTRTAVLKRNEAVQHLGAEYWERLRQAGHEIRLHSITQLDRYLPLLESKVIAAGGQVHWANDAADARRIVIEIARQHRAQRVVKVKSMLSEEIGLNEALSDAGLTALETDLGEYIVQLDGSRPSHPTNPSLHYTKEYIADLFRRKLGVDAPPEPMVLTEIARVKLREEFLRAEMGISGGNFLIAETGTLVLVTNEGNGRMCTTLPPVHVAVVGIEKVIPDWNSLAVLLQLLARSTTGQQMSSYTTFITGTREGGPREFHLVLLDNGRTRILQDARARETLLCIRCGACANICPVFQQVGGHAYGAVHVGPIGAILSTQLLGVHTAGDLAFASSLCGACVENCPVKVPFTELLLHLRRRAVEGDRFEPPVAPVVVRAGARAGTIAFAWSWLYEFGTQILRFAQAPLKRGDWLPVLPPPANRWTLARPFPKFGAEFRAWWRKRGARGVKREA